MFCTSSSEFTSNFELVFLLFSVQCSTSIPLRVLSPKGKEIGTPYFLEKGNKTQSAMLRELANYPIDLFLSFFACALACAYFSSSFPNKSLAQNQHTRFQNLQAPQIF